MPRPLKELPLFPTESEIARELFGAERINGWPAIVKSLELQGFPRIDPVFGRRYWPAVRQWLDHRYGVGTLGAPSAVDGEENWSCLKKGRSRQA
ncbi:hypothetical protein [Ancylobacter pratisalsi]|uniref:Winged helix-turn-helix domain-containing protein n=1 Tax=Ancylobacter pratisalsi TaxID=1745854 RepID=A0A6P1YSM7_9HYPH|nr:hypothetical protein [Ancylobacter pratisalsi]QIB35801.1 hypothetical protein G3A50_20365 [Ancylobacter pratisalsi]